MISHSIKSFHTFSSRSQPQNLLSLSLWNIKSRLHCNPYPENREIAFNPLRMKQSSDIAHRYSGAERTIKRRQPKTSCDERIALRGSHCASRDNACITARPYIARILLSLPRERRTLSFLPLTRVSCSFLLVQPADGVPLPLV